MKLPISTLVNTFFVVQSNFKATQSLSFGSHVCMNYKTHIYNIYNTYAYIFILVKQ